MIRQAITRQNEDYSTIQTAFSEKTFQSLLEVVSVVKSLPEACIDTVILEALKTDKNQQEIVIVEKFGFLILAEMRHFFSIHSIIKSKV